MHPHSHPSIHPTPYKVRSLELELEKKRLDQETIERAGQEATEQFAEFRKVSQRTAAELERQKRPNIIERNKRMEAAPYMPGVKGEALWAKQREEARRREVLEAQVRGDSDPEALVAAQMQYQMNMNNANNNMNNYREYVPAEKREITGFALAEGRTNVRPVDALKRGDSGLSN